MWYGKGEAPPPPPPFLPPSPKSSATALRASQVYLARAPANSIPFQIHLDPLRTFVLSYKCDFYGLLRVRGLPGAPGEAPNTA